MAMPAPLPHVSSLEGRVTHVGPALGAKGVNIAAFVKQFNDATAKLKGEIIPVVISVYKDKTFSFILKQLAFAALGATWLEIRAHCRLVSGGDSRDRDESRAVGGDVAGRASFCSDGGRLGFFLAPTRLNLILSIIS